ncbi:MAG: efflux RND transporter periplasmic adaptor subunit [Holosporales bacterium]|jgi:membrane fusion protein (multidrug efflux system)|nr:efflux RND transporter periplasmic adaptor subunit [Holosporales bacterium]
MLSKILEALKSLFSSSVGSSAKGTTSRANFWIQVAILLLSLFVVFIVYSSMKPIIKGICRIALQSDERSDIDQERAVGVEAQKAILGTTLREVKSIGVLKANAEVVIKSEIPGKVEFIRFTEGGNVKKGDLLIEFEDLLYKSEKEKSEAEYVLRRAEFERVNQLYNQKVGSKKNYDEALAQMNAAKAQLDIASFQLSKTVIKAPFDGTIGIMKGSVSPGNIVQQQTELVDIVDNSMVRVEFTVPAKYIEDIAVGQSVEITVDAFKDRAFSGAVDAIDSEVDPRNHSILARAVIPNRNGSLKHGMFANVKLVTGEKNNVVLIDEDSLDREGAIEFVWVIDNKGRAYRKRVLTGAKTAAGVEILAGVKEGEMVITTGQLKLTEGVVTKVLNKGNIETSRKHKKTDITDNVYGEDFPEYNEEADGKDEELDKDSVIDKIKGILGKSVKQEKE